MLQDMDDTPIRKRRWVRWGLFFGCWTLLGLFFASRSILIYSYRGEDFDWRLPLLMSLTEWYGWGALAPAILWLGRRVPFQRGSWLRATLVHLPASVFFSLVKVVMDGWLLPLVTGLEIPVSSAYKLHSNLLTYWAILGASLALENYRKYRERELRASQLETRLAEAQLQVLKMQLHPHFLFNTLHAISTLMHRDVEAAERMLTRLSDLLRHSLEHVGVQEVSLKQELEFLDRYVEIEKVRFGDRLAVEVRVDPELLDARVPNLILQPLVENAIRHGIAPRAAGGRIEIEARRDNGMLDLEIRDDGPGLSEVAGKEGNGGIGLANTRARLEQLYGAAHRFELSDAAGGGLAVNLAIPLSRE
jgi:signal transduction histidine kinase